MATISLLGTATFNTTAGTHTVVATPAVGDMIYLVVANTAYNGFVLPTDTAGGTYALVASATRAAGVDTVQIYARNSLITSATSTTFSHAPGASTSGGGVIAVKVTGMSLSGAASVIQSATQSNQAGAGTPAPVFGAIPNTNNPILGVNFNTSSTGVTPRTGYTELVDTSYATPTTGIEVMARASGETSATITWGSTSTACGNIAIEIDTASFSQSAYGFYEDGSEAASTIVGSASTPITRNTLSDSNLLLRARIQEGTGVAGPSTDDYQLQYSLNSGAYTNIGVGEASTVDSYSETNQDSTTLISTSGTGFVLGVAQSFTGDGKSIASVEFYIQRSGAPTGNLTAHLYAHSGTFGSSSIPTGSALATSATLDVSTVATNLSLYTFTFTTPFTSVNATKYVAELEISGTSDITTNFIRVGYDGSSPTHSGNSSTSSNLTTWTASSTKDYIFYVNGVSTVIPVVALNSASLTDGNATTNRLGSGTGSFVAGKISEDGLVDDLSITASNYTELLYALKLVATDTVTSDTLSFRVLRNGNPINSYAATPSITISKSAGTTTISITKGLIYEVKITPTAQTKSLKYTVKKTATALTKGLIYDIKKPVALTKTLIYDIKRTPAALTKALIYRVKKTYSITKSLIYDIKHATALTKSLKYTVIKSISATKSLKYTTKTTPSAITKALQYRIRLPTITLTKGLIYDVRHSISITKSLRYAVLKTTAVTKGLVYIVKRPVVLTKSLKYTVKKTLSTTKSLAYDIRTTPTAISKSLRYGIRKTYSQTKTLQYAVRPTIAVSKSLKYTIRKSIAQTKVLKYTIRISAISLTKALRYAIVKSQPITKSLRYTVKKTYTVTKSLAYVTTGGSILTKSLRYTITHSTAITTSLRYAINVRHKHNLDKSLTYRIAAPVAITKSLVYTINISLSTTKPLRYTIAKARATTKTLYYVVTARHAIQKALQYNLNVSARPTTPLQLGNDANILTLDASPSTPLLATDSRSIHLGNNETTTFLRDDVNTVILN